MLLLRINRPHDRVGKNVFADLKIFVLVTDDVFVAVALPDGLGGVWRVRLMDLAVFILK
jgi:hypothetical protein